MYRIYCSLGAEPGSSGVGDTMPGGIPSGGKFGPGDTIPGGTHPNTGAGDTIPGGTPSENSFGPGESSKWQIPTYPRQQ